VSTFGADPTTREERRRRTEACILEAARGLFAETGFERATIRAVAGRAAVDPALVMQYYGSKEGLFSAALHGAHGGESVREATREEIPTAALRDLLDKFEKAPDREAAVALMRSCLTHPEANRIMRDEVMCSIVASVARSIGGEDGELRAALLASCLVGVGLARYVFEIPCLVDASREDLERLLEPALRALVDTPGPTGGRSGRVPDGE
jgi:AcrR family transcriptional regulator